MQPFAVFRWLAFNPGATPVVVYVVVLGTMFVGRHIFQGQPYQLSYSAFLGSLAVFYTYKIAGEILQQQPGLVLYPLLRSGWFHLGCIATGYAGALYFQNVTSGRGWAWSKTEYMDLVYTMGFLPLIIYTCLVTVCVIFLHGSPHHKLLMMVLYFVYAILLGLDSYLEMLDQVPYARSHQIRSRLD